MSERCGHFIGQQGSIAIYCSKPKHAGASKCFAHDEKLIADRERAATELKRKAAAYDRLVARLAPDESLHPDLRKFVPFIHAVLEGDIG